MFLDIRSKTMVVSKLDNARSLSTFVDAAFFALVKCEIGSMRPRYANIKALCFGVCFNRKKVSCSLQN